MGKLKTLTPPHDQDCEASVLSAIVTKPDNFDRAAMVLQPEDFYFTTNQMLFRALLKMSHSSTPIDLITVIDFLKAGGKLEEAGGASYIAGLVDGFVTDAYFEKHCNIIKTKATLRRLISVTTRISAQCYEQQEEDIRELLEETEKVIFAAIYDKAENTIATVGEVAMEFIKTFDKREESGVPSGFVDLDRLTSGFQNGDLIILAARPSVGKTAFAINIAENCGNKNIPVGIFSLEMSSPQIISRMLSSQGKISGEKMRTKKLDDREYSRLASALGIVTSWQIFVDDKSGHTLIDLRSKARIMKRKHNIRMIIIDYLQLMQSGERIENRNLEVGQITRSLKLLARELNIPILLLSQLNRQVEQRGDKRPGLSDLRDSGQIEADADLIMFLYREHLYAPTEENERLAELIISKQRNGPLGTVNLIWNGDITQFSNGMPRSESAAEQWKEV